MFQQVLTVRLMKQTNPTTGEITVCHDFKDPTAVRVVAYQGQLSLTASMPEAELSEVKMWADKKGNQIFSAIVCSDIATVVPLQSINPKTGQIQFKAELGAITVYPLERGEDGKLHLVATPE